MDITPYLTSDVYKEYKADPNLEDDGDLTQTLGWEETQGTQIVSQTTATDVKEVVISRTQKITRDPSFKTITQLGGNSAESNDIQVLKHSQVALGELIGEGGYNQIFNVKSMPGDDEDTKDASMSSSEDSSYAVKILRNELVENDVQFALSACDIVKEALFLAALDHENIVKIKAVSEGGIASFEHGCRPDAFFMVMEKLDETLFDRIQKWKLKFRPVRSRPIDRRDFFQERLQVAAGISDGLAHMHSLNMIHRDLKPANLGFDSEGVIKIFDFGLSRLVPRSDDPNETFKLSQKAGTFRYISPENYMGQPYNLKSDVYSYSLLLYQVLSLKLPFKHLDGPEHKHQVFTRGARPTVPFYWPRSIRTLVQQGWAPQSSKRPTMQEIRDTIRKELE